MRYSCGKGKGMSESRGPHSIMELKREEIAGITVIRIAGSIKMGDSAFRFSEFMRDVLGSEGVRRVLLDMSGINYLDSMGLGELVGHLQRFRDEGGRIMLVRPGKRVFTLLQLSGLDEVFPMFESEEEAFSSLS
jgi:anti-sigma B factor antagonist